jgi:predicted RND superfamily exporter protein
LSSKEGAFDQLSTAEVGAERLWVLRYVAWLMRFRWLVIAATLVVVAAGSYGMRWLEVDADARLFFESTSPERQALDEMEVTYGGSRTNLIIVVAPEDGNVFSADTLAVIAKITELAWALPYVFRVNSLTNYQYSYSQGDTFIVEDLVPQGAELADTDLATVRTRALSQPELVGQLVSPDAKVTAVSALIVPPRGETQATLGIARDAERLVGELDEAYPSHRFYLTGGVISDLAFAQASNQDLQRLVPLMFALVVLCLWAALRSVWPVFVTLTVTTLSVSFAMGMAGWLDMTIDTVTAGAPIMCTTLAIADCVHVLSRAGQLQKSGLAYPAAIAESLRLNWTPVFLTSLTTVMSFLALNFADAPPFRAVGTIVAIGVVAAWAMSVATMPALLAVLPEPRHPPALSDRRLLERFASFVIRAKTLLLVGLLVGLGVVSLGIGKMKFDDNFIEYFSRSFEFRTDTEFMEEHLTGLNMIFYSVPSGEEGSVTDPDYLRKLDEFAGWLASQQKVAHVSAVTDILKRLNQSMNRNDPAFHTLPDSRELGAQYLLLYEMSLPEGFDVNNQINIQKSASLVAARLQDVSSAEIGALAEKGEQWLAQNGMPAPATGLSVMYSHLTADNIRTMLGGTVLVLITISGLMMIVLRSVKIGLISLVPNLLPALFAFGVWGWLGSEVNLAISVVAAMTFGIIVDDTIHMLTKYMHARREAGMSPEQAVRETLVSVGDPVLVTSVALVIGFGVLALSGFAVTHQLGLLSAMTIALAAVTDLLLLSPLLLWLDKDEPSRPLLFRRVRERRTKAEAWSSELADLPDRAKS